MRNWIFWLTAALCVMEGAKIAGVVSSGPMEVVLDAAGYWHLSDAVLEGDLFYRREEIAYRTPIYVWLVAAVRGIAGPHALFGLVLFQGLLAVGTGFLAGRVAQEISDREIALPLTCGIVLLGVSRILFVRAALTETLFTFLLTLHLLWVIRYCRQPTLWRAGIASLLFGVTLLTRPVPMLLWVVHGLLLVWPPSRLRRLTEDERLYPAGPWVRHEERMRQLRHLVIATGICLMVLTPWMYRNKVLFHRASLTEFTGRNVWIVTFQDGSGAGLPLPDSKAGRELRDRVLEVNPSSDLTQTWEVSHELTTWGLSDAEADRLMRRVAMDAIGESPGRWLASAGRRVVNYWRCAATELPEAGPRDGEYRRQWAWHFSIAPFAFWERHPLSASVPLNMLVTLVVMAAVVSLVIRSETRPWGLWCGAVLLYFCFVTAALEIPNYRYRLVVEPLMVAVVAAAIAPYLPRSTSPHATV